MQSQTPAWYCARTKPKHEHIAAANLRRNLDLEVFLPRLQFERTTQRGVVRVIEPLFHCYLFVHCVIEDKLDEIRNANGISSLVHFAHRMPKVADEVITELQSCFAVENLLAVENRLSPGDEVEVTSGAFAGMSALVLKNLPARKRVQILLDVLGRPTPVEVDYVSLAPGRNSLADLVPVLAAPLR